MGIDELNRQTVVSVRANSRRRTEPAVNIGIREAVALGQLPGWAARGAQGRLVSSTVGDFEIDVGATPPIRPDSLLAAGTLTVFSADANDNAAGSGARSVVVEYLDGEGYERLGVVAMDGVTSATAVKAERLRDSAGVLTGTIVPQSGGDPVDDCYRVLVAYAQQTGATGSNEGVIVVVIGADLQTMVEAGQNRSRHAFFAVPRGQVALVTGVGLQGNSFVSADVVRAQARVTANSAGVSFMAPWQLFQSIGTGISGVIRELPVWRRMKPLSEIRMLYQKQGGGGESVIGGFDILTAPDSNDPDPAFESAPELLPVRMG